MKAAMPTDGRLRRVVGFAAAFSLAIALCLSLYAQSGAGSSSQIPTFRSDVRLVNVYATVLNHDGAPVAELTRGDFQVLEDDVPQSIAMFDRESEVPLNIVIAVDTSLSTRKDLPLEVAAARRFARDILRPEDRLAVYRFDENVTEIVPFTSDIKAIERGLEHVRTGAATSLFDAVYLAADTLAGRRGRKALVVITDGGDTTSRMGFQDALRSAIQSEALVYSIIDVPIEASAGRDIGGEHALMQFAQDTGGKYFYAGKPGQLDEAFHQIDRELRTQYVLGYYAKARDDGKQFRRIDVRVRTTGAEPGGGGESAYTVRHRTGYYTH
ncbi:MAG: VWA domain-containing protein [Acidobacteria bacterium]|nr:VWA domain-containing protein [Acidobacteriota bacterium]